MARATRRDVAKLAGVSLSTVSHVMNGRADELGFAPETARRVRVAAEELGYIPRASARGFRYQSSKTIAMFLPPMSSSWRLPVFSDLLTGSISRAQERAHFILPVVGNEAPASLAETTVREVELVGAICRAGVGMEPAAEVLLRAEIPVVWIETGGPALRRPGAASLGIDEATGVRAMLEALDLAGISEVMYLTGPGATSSRTVPFFERFPDAHVVTAEGWFSEDASIALQRALDDGSAMPGLIFAANDHLLVGAVRLLASHGLRPGVDVQAFGHGDVEGGPASLLDLSSVGWPVAELGARAVDLLLDSKSTARSGHPVIMNLDTRAHPRSSTRLRLTPHLTDR